MAVRCYVMKKQLDELINGGWKEKDEFTKFKEAQAKSRQALLSGPGRL